MAAAPSPPAGGRPERLAWLLLALCYPALSLVKIHPVDVPWHLATARLAAETGAWPTRNTFSYTFPDHPLYQQYPVFQATIHAVWRGLGWEGLTLLLAAAWAAVFVLFVRWGGPLRRAGPFHLAWAVVLFSLQTRMALRPDVLSLLLLGLMLLALDAYREGRRPALAAVPLLHLVWVNGHQLFVLSFAVQGLFLGHLVLSRLGPRLGIDRADAAVPLLPPALALAASAGLSFLTPLGPEIVHVFAQTSGSLAHHRHHVQELARVWSEPAWLALSSILLAASGWALWRTRRAWRPFEVGLWLLALAVAINAVRGLVYFTLVAGAVLERSLLRHPPRVELTPLLRRFFRRLAVALTGVLAFGVVYHRWIAPPHAPGAAEPGLGRTVADWPDAALAALRADPPPGRMMNVPWALANAVIWQWPEQPVFVDPRFEAYPRRFLVDAIASYHDDAVLDRLIAEHRPDWIFGGHCPANQRARLTRLARGPDWALTHADSQTLVLVRRTPDTAAYRARHEIPPAADPPDLLPQPRRRAHQRLCWARLLQALGHEPEARAQLARAQAEAGPQPELQTEIARALAPTR